MSERQVRPEVFAGAAADTGARDGGVADIEIEATVRATELRHVDRPRTRMRVDGSPAVSREDETVRENLPDSLEPDRTYRGVRVRRRLGARLTGPP